MAVTLQQLYEQVKDKEEIRLVAGEAGITNIVRWVHMVESKEISAFLEGNEVAFTTGIALKDTQELLDLVKRNHQWKAAGMVINVGPYIEEIPPEVLAYGDEHNFPIFRVPWRVHMSNIMREFSTEIHRDNLRKMELESAFKNAFYMSDNEALYVPTLQKNGFRKEWSYVVALAQMKKTQKNTFPSDLFQRLLHLGVDYFRTWRKEVVVWQEEDAIVAVFCNASEADVVQRIEGFIAHAKTYIREPFCIYTGVGAKAESVTQIGHSFAQAEKVLRLQKKRKQQNVLSYEQTGLYKIIFSLEGQEVLEEFFQETMGALLAYDEIKGSDYVEFLQRYFQLDCNVTQIAEDMHLHRNSVTYKLHKIEEILEVSLADKMVQTKLMVALMMLEMR